MHFLRQESCFLFANSRNTPYQSWLRLWSALSLQFTAAIILHFIGLTHHTSISANFAQADNNNNNTSNAEQVYDPASRSS